MHQEVSLQKHRAPALNTADVFLLCAVETVKLCILSCISCVPDRPVQGGFKASLLLNGDTHHVFLSHCQANAARADPPSPGKLPFCLQQRSLLVGPPIVFMNYITGESLAIL